MNELTWIQKHERLLLVGLVLGAVLFITTKVINHFAESDKIKAAISQASLAVQEKKNEDDKQQIQQLVSQNEKLMESLTQQNAVLASSIASRNANVSRVQETDKTIPLPQLGNRWQALLNLQPTDVSATASGFQVSDAGARTTVQQLELVPVLQQNLKDEQTISSNKEGQISSLSGVVTGLQTQVTNLSTTISEQKATCDTQIKALKAENRRSKWKTFWIGFATGFGVREAIKP